MVFLDDLGRNVRSAREVGMTAVRVRGTEEALRELETLLGTDRDWTELHNCPHAHNSPAYNERLLLVLIDASTVALP